jgi:hypothetical protein
MQTDLRPMSLGEILDRTAQLYRTNFLLFAGIAAVYAGVLLVLNLGQLGVQQLLLAQHMTRQLPLFTLGYVILILPLMFIATGAAVAANNRAVAWVNLGQPATIRGAYQSILPKLGRYLWLTAMIAFFIYLPFVVLFTGYFIFLFSYGFSKGVFATGGKSDPQAMIVVGIVTIVFFLLAAAATIYAIVMFLRYSLSIPAAVVEDLNARKAIRRSIELSRGSRGRIFVLLLLIFVIELGLVSITQVFFIVAAFTAVKNHGQPSVWLQIGQQIVGFVTNSFIGPMYATGLTLFYYDQRVRKEGFDIEWMMEAAGMNTSALPADGEAVATQHEPVGDALGDTMEPWPEIEPTATPEAATPADGSSPAQSPPESTPPESTHG